MATITFPEQPRILLRRANPKGACENHIPLKNHEVAGPDETELVLLVLLAFLLLLLLVLSGRAARTAVPAPAGHVVVELGAGCWAVGPRILPLHHHHSHRRGSPDPSAKAGARRLLIRAVADLAVARRLAARWLAAGGYPRHYVVDVVVEDVLSQAAGLLLVRYALRVPPLLSAFSTLVIALGALLRLFPGDAQTCNCNSLWFTGLFQFHSHVHFLRREHTPGHRVGVGVVTATATLLKRALGWRNWCGGRVLRAACKKEK